MELLQLHYFRTVARLEHMTKAANELRIAQPALSKTIARLEDDLGVPLFDRQGRQIKLNTYGKAFLRKTEMALSLLEEGRREVNDLAGLETGSIHLATTTLNRLTKPLGIFLSQYPKINFRITQVSLDEMGKLLTENGDIDFGFSMTPVEQPGICAVPVLQENVYIAVPFGHRLANQETTFLHELANEPFISYKEGHPIRKMNEEICIREGFMPNVVCEVDEPGSIANLVQAGLGVAFVGNCIGDEDLPYHRLKIDDTESSRTFQLVWHENRYLSLAAQKFREFLVDYWTAET
ncbi:LysR family transcriptional regulator [Brevibacillus migulae]|uniref:LysR family transcriptional regulator n=1 Tax=Brevibacillus migulae TaxID=1644114 RepID=UPI00106E575E|nr:LysR family transcriptional regulator [Brevibacillus migulae]